MRAMVFAAGLGTRLRPLTEILPKPAVPFFGRPLSCWTLDHLARAGATSAVVNTHHLAERAEAAIAAGAPRGLAVAFSREEVLLGTGGGLRRAWELEERLRGRMGEGEVLVVMNGDILFAPDLSRLVALHRSSGALATMALRHAADPWSMGAIEIDAAGHIVAMLGRQPSAAGTEAAMFTGVHVFSRAALELLPAEGCVVRKGYVRWLAEGLPLGGIVCDEPWLDLGTPRVYRDAHLEVLRGQRALPGVEAGRAWVAPDAEVGSAAALEECVIGAGAEVGDVRVERSVVWPGARVRADVADAIVLPDGLVVAV